MDLDRGNRQDSDPGQEAIPLNSQRRNTHDNNETHKTDGKKLEDGTYLVQAIFSIAERHRMDQEALFQSRPGPE